MSNITALYRDEYLNDEIKKAQIFLEQRKNYRESQDFLLQQQVAFLDAEFKIAVALQMIWIMIYLGAVHLSYALAMNAPNIVSDWVLVAKHVNEIRGENPETLVYVI